MDLGAYAKIDDLSQVMEDNGIEVPRLRGLRLMSEEIPLTKEEITNALWYLRNYRDLLMFVESMCKNEEFIKTHYLEDLKQ